MPLVGSMSAMPTAMVKWNDSPGLRVNGPHCRPMKRLVLLVSGSGFGPALAILAVANEYTTRV